MEFHDDYPSYETMYNHDETYGKKARRKLWNVFWIMLVITIVELLIGTFADKMGLLTDLRGSTLSLKAIFVILTIVKAGYIVMSFMHLGHEVKFMKYIILMPYIVFMFYAIFIILVEGTYAGGDGRVTKVDPVIVKQQKTILEHHKSGGGHHAEPHDKAAESGNMENQAKH
jgi:cytochrome c oxidase subunit IV